jgi:hypothetical protein
MGLVLDEVIVQGEGVSIQKHPFSVQLDNPGTLEVRIGEKQLAAFLEKKAPGGLSDFRVKLTNDEIHVEANARIIFTVGVTAICTLRIVDGRQLFVDLARLDALGGQSTFNMVQAQLDKINPVLDVEDLPVNAVLTKVESNSVLTLYGLISPKAE